MRFIVIFLCFMLIKNIYAELEDKREKEKDEKIRSLLSQANVKIKGNHGHEGFLLNLVELLLDVVNDVRTDLKKLKMRNGTSGIGFTATTVGTDQTLKAFTPIPFSKMISDHGGGFKIVNGQFVCLKDGLYQFTASVCIATASVWVKMYKNKSEIGYLYKDHDSNYGSGSGSTIVRMVKGDIFYLASIVDTRIWEKVTIISGFRISN